MTEKSFEHVYDMSERIKKSMGKSRLPKETLLCYRLEGIMGELLVKLKFEHPQAFLDAINLLKEKDC